MTISRRQFVGNVADAGIASITPSKVELTVADTAGVPATARTKAQELGSKLINSCGFISKCEFLAGMTTNLSEFRRRARITRCALRGMYADFLGFYRFDRNSGAAQLMSLDPN